MIDTSKVFAVHLFPSAGTHPHIELVEIDNTLNAFQSAVGGYIEAYTIQAQSVKSSFAGKEPIVVICDEDGRYKELDSCCRLGELDFVGDLLVVGQTGDKFSDVPLWFVHYVGFF